MSTTSQAKVLALQYQSDKHGRGIQALAKELGFNETTLTQQLNRTGSAKLGVEDLVLMTQFTGDLRALNAMAAECKCMVLPVPESMTVEGDDAMHLVSKLMAELNDTVQAYVAAMSDGKVTGNEVENIKRQGGELQIALQKLVGHAVSMHQAALPAALRSVA